jgi:sensor c-di-GMP phosphodiesterase-like protein
MDLQAAIGPDQSFLLFQPIFDLNDMAVVGVKALLRWNDPSVDCSSPPDELILALETSGLFMACVRAIRSRVELVSIGRNNKRLG